MPDQSKRRGIYLLPNLLTTAGLFSGFFGIIASINGEFQIAAIAIFVAMVFDGLDGRVARLTNTQSEFGAEYDSMADIVSFGIAPALVAYHWALSDMDKLGWLAAFIFVAGGALRLARFNASVATADKRYFQGLAIPSAAAIIAGFVWVGAKYDIEPGSVSYLLVFFTIACGLLMVSNFKYHSFKEVNWRSNVNFVVLLIIVLIFVVVATAPAVVLFVMFTIYAISGPVMTIKNVSKLKLEDVIGDPQEDQCVANATQNDQKKQQQSSASQPEDANKTGD